MTGAVGVGGRGFERFDLDPLGLGGRRDGWRTAAAVEGFGGFGCLLEEAGAGFFLVSCVLMFLVLSLTLSLSCKVGSCDLGLGTLSAATRSLAEALILDR